MGTIGGKIGVSLGLVTGLLAVGPLLELVLGNCFFEQECENETAGLALVAAASLAVAVAVGVSMRAVVNWAVRTVR